uniref:Transposase n=1 Tax=Aromatoleum buckelii TaxID=200254 RepID=A0ABX1N803_9RHOO
MRICRARSLSPARRTNDAAATLGLDRQIARQVSEARRLCRGEHRRDSPLLPLSRVHRKHWESTNMLERPNEEIKRRTHVVRIFPNVESCLRLIRALCVETHEEPLEDSRYLIVAAAAAHARSCRTTLNTVDRRVFGSSNWWY